MADWVVSDAGTTACNGDYTENGTEDGKPAYEKDGGGMWLYWYGTYWSIYTTKGSENYYYYATEADLPGNPWSSVGGEGGDPAPTVAAVGGNGGGVPVKTAHYRRRRAG